jgi:hypothetical protein
MVNESVCILDMGESIFDGKFKFLLEDSVRPTFKRGFYWIFYYILKPFKLLADGLNSAKMEGFKLYFPTDVTKYLN